MGESTTRPWMVIRQDEDGGRYRVGRCATRVEAERLAHRLGATHSGVRPGADGAGRPGEASPPDGAPVPEAAPGTSGGGPQRYLVERLEQPSGDPV
ncbi:hypothetical protein [Streptomyces sp. TRM 70351]|uniref:hypothetical protein n=1 Tax=Streptomyces sp. TRM 70351 TaxID=3116552 RepID=UPI003FCCECEE